MVSLTSMTTVQTMQVRATTDASLVVQMPMAMAMQTPSIPSRPHHLNGPTPMKTAMVILQLASMGTSAQVFTVLRQKIALAAQTAMAMDGQTRVHYGALIRGLMPLSKTPANMQMQMAMVSAMPQMGLKRTLAHLKQARPSKIGLVVQMMMAMVGQTRQTLSQMILRSIWILTMTALVMHLTAINQTVAHNYRAIQQRADTVV